MSEPAAPAVAGSSGPTPASGTALVEPRPPWTGPFLGITRSSTGIYAEPTFARERKLGYAQEGAKLPVHPELVRKDNCKEGWYRLVDGGYVCGSHGTTQLDDPRIKFGPSQPDLSKVLPYRYARNTRNGTPLYKSVPSREQLEQYEPHLFPDKAAQDESNRASGDPAKATVSPAPDAPADESTRKAQEDQERRMAALRAARRAMLGEEAEADDQGATPPQDTPAAAVAPSAAPTTDPARPWWQEEDPELHRLSIGDLASEGDGVLASRMVKGFYIAVDKVFDWNKRRWFKSTKGFVAPADSFHFAEGSDFRGVELSAEWRLPIGFVYGPKATRSTYSLAEDGRTLKPEGSVKRFSALNLTGEEKEFGGKAYMQTSEGHWIRKSELRITLPGPPPEELEPGELWLDVNLSAQTLVAFRGTEPFYATLVSTGKSSKDPDKDHSTPLGKWRIREKHITATMDGDGSAAGDLPYSIEAVPYVMYYHKAYAVHGAFWHQNYGVQMSHGCVNLAPRDANYLFFHTNPPVAEGWHGAWASEEHKGSFVVVHE